MPAYVLQLFGLDDVIANGAVLAVIGTIRDDLDIRYQSYLQTASLLASVVSRSNDKTEFSSVREFVLAVIAMIKQPLAQIQVMKHPLVSSRFTSPQALVHAIEDQCLKSTVLRSSRFSAVEWNDLMISLANVLGMNVLLLEQLSLGASIKKLSKQLTMTRLRSMADYYQPYIIRDDLFDQKLALIELSSSSKMITTVCSVSTVSKVLPISVEPTASLRDALSFITDYNSFLLRETKNTDDLLRSYQLYLQALTTDAYEFVALKAYLVKVSKFVVVDTEVIGAVLDVVDVKSVVATELMFFRPFPVSELNGELVHLRNELSAKRERVDTKALLCYPIAPTLLTDIDHAIVKWLNHPLRLEPPAKECSHSLIASYSTGLYQNGIYRLLSKDIVEAWRAERPQALLETIIHEVKKMGSLPYPQTKIDTLAASLVTQFVNYDPLLLRIAVTKIFELINSVDQTTAQAIEHIRSAPELDSFDLKNMHRLTRDQLSAKLKVLFHELTMKVDTYPLFKVDTPSQDETFYDAKSGKLLVHQSMASDLLDMLVSDFSNPFRRDLIVHQPFMEEAFIDIYPHIGELIYAQSLR